MATASNPRTTGRFIQRTFDHLLVRSPKRSSQGVPTRVQSKPQFVHVHDRIPLWNISRGDRVRVISGSRKGKIGTVDYVDRERNRIFLNELEFCRPKAVPSQHKHSIFNDPDFRPNQTVLNQIPIHYSNVQLVLQRSPEQLAADQAAQENPNAPLPEVVAKRLRAVGPHYDWRGKGRWTWKRLAATVAEIEPKTGHTHAVDWPREQRFAKFIPTTRPLPMTAAAHDSAVSTAVQSTFVPSPTPVENPPPELAIRDIEFFNPNGRARKAKRYKAKKEAAAQLAKGGKGHAERPSSQPSSAPATPVSFLEA